MWQGFRKAPDGAMVKAVLKMSIEFHPSLERENLDVDLRAELSKKRNMQIEVRGDGTRRRGKKV